MKFAFFASRRKTGGKDLITVAGLFVVPAVFLMIFFYYPLANIVKIAFFNNGKFSLEVIFGALCNSYIARVILFTFKEAFVSALFTLVVAFPGAYVISHFKFAGKKFFLSLVTVPFILPSVLVALGFIALFGKSGVINSLLIKVLHFHKPVNLLYSFWGIILVHTFYNFPVPLRIISAAWEGIPKRYAYAAKSLGASDIRLFFQVTLPLLLPSIVASFTLVFMFCFLSFVIILTIGGARFATIEVSIYTYYNMFLDYKTGSALALLQAVFSLFFIYVYSRANGFVRAVSYAGISEKRKLSGARKGVFFIVFPYGAFVLLAIILPLCVIFAYSLIDPASGRLSFVNFKNLFSGAFDYVTSIGVWRITANSFFFATLTMIFANVLALLSSYGIKHLGKIKDATLAFLMLPIAISPVTIAFSFVLTFKNVNFILGSWLIIAAAHIVIAFPFALRTLYSAVERIPQSLVYAARSLGMGRTRAFFRVDLKILKQHIFASAVFAFAISMGEFGATFMLYKNRYITMPVALYRFISGRHFGLAYATGALLAGLSIVIFFAIDKLNKEASLI